MVASNHCLYEGVMQSVASLFLVWLEGLVGKAEEVLRELGARLLLNLETANEGPV